jgi:serine/threonine protein kinase
MSSWSIALFVLGAVAIAAGLWLQRRHRRRPTSTPPSRTEGPHASASPDRIGPYVLHGKLGAGGMGTVYEARHVTLGRWTALKLAKAESTDPLHHARFEREAVLTSALRHPHVVTLFDHGKTEEGVAWIALEHVDGATLDGVLRTEGPLPAARVLPILRQLASALAHAHAASIVHRDVKPSNVMIDRAGDADVVKLIDFGLAKRMSAEHREHARTSIVGTPLFMAPESSDPAADVGPEVDIYGVGMIGWALLTGTFLFGDHDSVSLPRAHRKEPPLPPSLKTDAPVPADLERVLLRCLEKIRAVASPTAQRSSRRSRPAPRPRPKRSSSVVLRSSRGPACATRATPARSRSSASETPPRSDTTAAASWHPASRCSLFAARPRPTSRSSSS